MKNIYKCPHCGYEEEVFDEDLEFMQPCCKECFSSMEFYKEIYTHQESANEDYFECMNDYYDGTIGV